MKYLEYNQGSELKIFPMNNEQWKLNQSKIIEWIKSRTKDEQKMNELFNDNKNKSNNNNKQYTI